MSWNSRGYPLYKCGQGRANQRDESLFRTGRGMCVGITLNIIKYTGLEKDVFVI